MCAAEGQEGFDSWRQEDQRILKNKICLAILNRYNFNNVLDVGCGKGTFTQLLKKENNRVTSIDVSETAIRKAAIRFPDIDFECIDLTKPDLISLPFYRKHYDLILFMEVLPYLPN
jgi:2-polyprenyl-3-methyl-5-hydroxy-6-metoxy-1,4-benzoquinol methylase